MRRSGLLLAGLTPLRLRFEQPPASAAYRFLRSVSAVTLSVQY